MFLHQFSSNSQDFQQQIRSVANSFDSFELTALSNIFPVPLNFVNKKCMSQKLSVSHCPRNNDHAERFFGMVYYPSLMIILMVSFQPIPVILRLEPPDCGLDKATRDASAIPCLPKHSWGNFGTDSTTGARLQDMRVAPKTNNDRRTKGALDVGKLVGKL